MPKVKTDMGRLRSLVAEVNAGAKPLKWWGIRCPVGFDYWINTLNDEAIESQIEKRYQASGFGPVVSIGGVRLASTWPRGTDYYTFRAQSFRDDWNKGYISLYFSCSKKDM